MATSMHNTPQMTGEPPDGFAYVSDALTCQQHDDLLRLVTALPYEHERVRGRLLRRGYAQFGWAYVTVGRRLKPAPLLPEFLSALADRVLPNCPGVGRFDQCIVTWYPEGTGIGWHADADCFGDCVVAFSLASPALLQLRPLGSKRPTCAVSLAPGSLYVMRGPARWEYAHQVEAVDAERYSITFRTVDPRA